MTVFNDKTTGLLNFSDLKKVRFKALYWIMFAILTAVSLTAVLPLIWVFFSGFKTTAEMYSVPPTLLPSHIDLGMLKGAWNKVNFGSGYWSSFCIVIGCLIFDICSNGMLGYVLSRIKPTGSNFIDTLIFWSMLLPGISMVPLYITFVDVPFVHINLTGSYLPLWLMAGCNAFNVLLFRSYFNSIPMSYLEAARMDGCSDLTAFFRIIIPLSKPIIIVVSIFSVTYSWNNFMWPYLILGSTPHEPVAVKLYQLSNDGNIQDNEMMIVTMFSIIPPMIVYSFFSKHILGGLNMSGIKG